MIKIDLYSKGRKTEGTIQVRGDEETLTNEIYVIMRTLSNECPIPFDNAVDKHLQDMIEEQEDEKDYS